MTEETLRKYLPGYLQHGRGEQSLLGRVAPWIDTAEQFLHTDIITKELLPEPSPDPQNSTSNIQNSKLLSIADTIVATYALYLAVPALDITLSSTGFAVGSTDSLAPASAARVKELRQSLLHTRDQAIADIIPHLRKIPGWNDTKQGQSLSGTIIRIRDIAAITRQPLSYDRFRDALPTIRAIELDTAAHHISMPVYRQIIAAVSDIEDGLLKTDNIQNSTFNIIAEITVCVTEYLRRTIDEALRQQIDPFLKLDAGRRLDQAVTIIRENPAAFPGWAASDTARLFGRQSFRNTRTSGGYFF